MWKIVDIVFFVVVLVGGFYCVWLAYKDTRQKRMRKPGKVSPTATRKVGTPAGATVNGKVALFSDVDMEGWRLRDKTAQEKKLAKPRAQSQDDEEDNDWDGTKDTFRIHKPYGASPFSVSCFPRGLDD